jgi:hypothetical protein
VLESEVNILLGIGQSDIILLHGMRYIGTRLVGLIVLLRDFPGILLIDSHIRLYANNHAFHAISTHSNQQRLHSSR